MSNTVKLTATQEIQEIRADLILKDGVSYEEAILLVKKTITDMNTRNLDVMISRSSAIVQGEEELCLELRSYFQPKDRTMLDARIWRKNFFAMLDIVMAHVSMWGVVKDVNDRTNLLMTRLVSKS